MEIEIRRSFPSPVRLIAPLLLVWAICLLPVGVGSARADPPTLYADVDDDGVMIREGERPVLHYQRATKSMQGKWPRADYVHPLYDLQGNVVTEDFPSDHGHHRGVFWAWHQVWLGEKRLGDPWVCKDFVWEVQSICVTSPASPLTLIADVHWKSPDHVDESGQMIPVVHETTRITVHRSTPRYQSIDFDIALEAMVSELKIGGSEDDKGYGGFSPRIKLSGTEQFLSSAGEVEPAKTAVEAGSWINIKNETGGVVMITHDENPGSAGQDGSAHARPWILRRQRSMQNAVFPGREPVEIPMDEPMRLRYRFVLYDGSLSSDRIAAIATEFSDS